MSSNPNILKVEKSLAESATPLSEIFFPPKKAVAPTPVAKPTVVAPPPELAPPTRPVVTAIPYEQYPWKLTPEEKAWIAHKAEETASWLAEEAHKGAEWLKREIEKWKKARKKLKKVV